MNVAIVNDSRIAVEVLRRIVSSEPGFDVAWVAYSGEEAISKFAEQQPDIVLMDLVMPGIDGAETTRRIMEHARSVILVVTATTVGNRDMVFEAMGHGALDAVNTPTVGRGGDLSGAEPLLQKLRIVSRLVSPSHHRRSHGSHKVTHPQSAPALTRELPIVAIGASTGGPQALAAVLGSLPPTLPAAVLISQHVDEQFAPGLVEWLQRHSALAVRMAKTGEAIQAGVVYIAGTRDHLIYVERADGVGTLAYTPEPVDTPYRPSVDALFNSLALPHGAPRVGVLLTGMGRDGAEGLRAMRNTGSLTIAQDEATSVVYGMPKAAAALKAAIDILPLNQIAARITQAVVKRPL